jgi:hypothetical protein
MRSVRSIAVLIMWWKFFYFLRIFDATAPLIRILFQIAEEMAAFTFVLFLTVIAFANAFIILSYNRTGNDK